MALCVVWIEGVDLNETMFDTDRLSVIRGASRAYEAMPVLARREYFAGATVVALGASMAGFLFQGDAKAAGDALKPLRAELDLRGFAPDRVAKCVKSTDQDEILAAAPFAHLRFHSVVVPVASPEDDDAIAVAIEKARARIRVMQLQEPGVRLRPVPEPGVSGPCALDRKRAAEVWVHLPESSERQGVSRASAARWHYGRAMRQGIYGAVGTALRPVSFVDDFQEMVQKEPVGNERLPMLPGDSDTARAMPESVKNKLAVFNADGDRFTTLRQKLTKALGTADGQQVFSLTVDACMRKLLNSLVADLVALCDSDERDARAAASLPFSETIAHRKLREERGLALEDRLLRFETLIFGGDDTLFVVPAWLGWWLAAAFFQRTRDWEVSAEDVKQHLGYDTADAARRAVIDAKIAKLEAAAAGEHGTRTFALNFSAGLVFADRKTPIRAVKTLAHDLMQQAKDSGGGLEIEVLESIEPPAEGLSGLRDRIFGKGWRWREEDKERSALTIPRRAVLDHFDALAGFWTGSNALPTNQMHRALRQARRAGRPAGGLAGTAAAEAARVALSAAAMRSRDVESFDLGGSRLLPAILPPTKDGKVADQAALRLHFLLQQRDYVVACHPWLNAMPAFQSRPPRATAKS